MSPFYIYRCKVSSPPNLRFYALRWIVTGVIKTNPVKTNFNVLLKKTEKTFTRLIFHIAFIWVICITLFQIVLISLHLTGNEKLALSLINGDFQIKEIWVDKVTNSVKIGNLADQ